MLSETMDLFFIPEPVILGQFVIACVVLAITPGPDMTLFLARALSQGRLAGLACMSGALSGIIVHTSMVALGLSALIIAAPAAFTTLRIVGAGYLIWLAIDALRNGSSLSLRPESRKQLGFWRNYLTGLGINLLNPKIILFFMTFLPQFVRVTDPHAAAKLFFLGVLFIVVSVPIVVPMILMAERLSSFLSRQPKVTRLIDYLFAGVFSAFAAKIILTRIN
jgi:threonine/homoserine/homoserine lactone efflux protein